MAEFAISLTDVESGEVVMIGSDNMVKVFAEGSGSKILYSNQGADLKSATVTQTPAAVASATGNLFTVTQDGSVVYLNANRVNRIVPYGTGSKVLYDSEGAREEILSVDETLAAIQAQDPPFTTTP